MMKLSPEGAAYEAAREELADALAKAKAAAVRDVAAGMTRAEAAELNGVSRPTLNAALR